MKVLFLDIDGVLNVIPEGHDRFGPTFHGHFVDELSRVIRETDAKIVLSSTWRFMGMPRVLEMWKHRGLPGKVVGVTPDLATFSSKPDILREDRTVRGDEIEAWLANKGVSAYAIADDDTDMLEHQLRFFVRTSDNQGHAGNVEGYGLTTECADRLIEILNA